jgi:hypothetical protein
MAQEFSNEAGRASCPVNQLRSQSAIEVEWRPPRVYLGLNLLVCPRGLAGLGTPYTA